MAFDKAGQVASRQVQPTTTERDLTLPDQVFAVIGEKLEGMDKDFAESYRQLVDAYNSLLEALQDQVKISSFSELSFPAGQDISKYQVVWLADSHLLFPAFNTAVEEVSRIVGLSPVDAVIGDNLSPVHDGILFDETWEWTPQNHIYLGADGVLTETAPVAAPAYLVFIGEALTSNLIRVHIDYPITLP